MVRAPRHFLPQVIESQACTIAIRALRGINTKQDHTLRDEVSAHSRDNAGLAGFFGPYSGVLGLLRGVIQQKPVQSNIGHGAGERFKIHRLYDVTVRAQRIRLLNIGFFT